MTLQGIRDGDPRSDPYKLTPSERDLLVRLLPVLAEIARTDVPNEPGLESELKVLEAVFRLGDPSLDVHAIRTMGHLSEAQGALVGTRGATPWNLTMAKLAYWTRHKSDQERLSSLTELLSILEKGASGSPVAG